MWWIIVLFIAISAGALALTHFRWPLFRAAVRAQRGKVSEPDKCRGFPPKTPDLIKFISQFIPKDLSFLDFFVGYDLGFL